MVERRRTRKPSSRADRQRLIERLDEFHRFIQECAECQSEAPAHWQFCANCGARLSTQCPGCGQPLPPSGARFCPHCGVEIPRAEA